MNKLNTFSNYFKEIPTLNMIYRNYSHILVEVEKLFSVYLKDRTADNFEKFISNYKLLGLNSGDCLEFMKMRKHDFLQEGYTIPQVISVNSLEKVTMPKKMRSPYYLKSNDISEIAYGHRVCLLHRRSEDCQNCGEKN